MCATSGVFRQPSLPNPEKPKPGWPIRNPPRIPPLTACVLGNGLASLARAFIW